MFTFRLQSFLRRTAQLAVVLVGSTFLLAMLLLLLPVGMEELYVISVDGAGRLAQLKRLRLDRNPVFGYLGWLWDFVRGDFGPIIYPGAGEEAVSGRVTRALPISLLIVLYVQVVALLVAIPLGIATAYRAGTKGEKVVSYSLFTASAIPNFVFALLLAAFFRRHSRVAATAWLRAFVGGCGRAPANHGAPSLGLGDTNGCNLYAPLAHGCDRCAS